MSVFGAPAEAPATSTAGILVVDDQPAALCAMEAMLKDFGQDLVLASSGADALRRLLERDFAVILLDVRMPGMDGFETAELIRSRERSRTIPIIFLTADQSEPQVRRGYAAGAVDYLAKPVVPEILRSKVSVFVDLHLKSLEVRRQAEELLALNRELEERHAELEAFAFSVSHDLRSPINAAAGFAQALREDCGDALGETGREYLRRISGCLGRMDALIQDLLAYSRLCRMEVRISPVALGPVVAQALAGLEAEVRGSGASVVVEEPLPAVMGHRAVVEQVVVNLLANALKFVRPGEPPRVRVQGEGRGSVARFRVEDEGIGIAPENQQRIFQPFERLHGGDAYPGTGIGLAIVRRGVARMGGSVEVESSPGKGSRFTVELPKAEGTS